MTRPSVLLVEDEDALRKALGEYLGLAGFAATTVATGIAFYAKLAEQRFDVTVIDLGLPDQGGETLVEYVRRNTTSAIIVMTARDNVDTRVACYRAGAHQFLRKPVEGRELAAAIASLTAAPPKADTAATAGPAAAGPVSDAPRWKLDATRWVLTSPDGKQVQLAAKEHALVLALATQPGRTTTRDELLKLLYQRDNESAQTALEGLVRRTRQKIAAETGVAAPILTEYGVGYAFAGAVTVEG